MLAIIRGIIVILYTILVVTFGMIYCMFSPRNPKHVMTYGRLFGKLSHVFGIKLVERFPKEAKVMAQVFILETIKIILIW